jgi:hypothetical protein
LGLALDQVRYFNSDDVLKHDGFLKLRTRIINEKIKRVDIVGGSHSGFSVAWMLLNGSAMYDYKPRSFDAGIVSDPKGLTANIVP